MIPREAGERLFCKQTLLGLLSQMPRLVDLPDIVVSAASLGDWFNICQ